MPGPARLDPLPTPSRASSRPAPARRSPHGRAEKPLVYERTPGAASRPLASPPPTAAATSPAPPTAAYQRRQPERTILYRAVARELEPLDRWLAERNPFGHGLPAHVRRELEGLLDCGILSRGFTRVVCRRCRFEHLVAFSCRSRSACPSCAARRMDDTAAHLVDRVLPWATYRQWVVTFTPRVRCHLAADPALASRAITAVVRTLSAWQRTKARRRGVKLPRNTSRVGCAVVFVQRFDSALRVNFHLHLLLPDGVFVRDPAQPDARPRLAPIDAPNDDEVRALLDRIIERTTALVRPRLSEADASDDVDLDNPARQLEVFAARSVARSASTPMDDDPGPRCARKDGWSLHADVAVHQNDRLGLERLARYCLRPPISPARLRETEDGHILYFMKRRWSDGTDTLRLTPRELVLRLCALIPPPRSHLIRYFGPVAGHSRGRHALTGRGLHDPPTSPTASPATAATAVAIAPTTPPPGRPDSSSILEDIKGPDNPDRAPRLPWARLLARVWRTDVLVCPRCGGDMRVVAVIEDEPVVLRILRHLGYPTTAPPRGPPRPLGQLPLDLAPGGSAPTDGVDPPYVDN